MGPESNDELLTATAADPAPRVEGATAPVERASSLSGRVVDAGGAGLPDARVEWIALGPEDVELTPAWPGTGWGIVTRTRLETRTDGAGRFRLETSPGVPGPHGSLAIAALAGFRVAGLRLDADPATWPGEIRIVLEPAAPVAVRVLDGSGGAVAGAVVRRCGGSTRAFALERYASDAVGADADGRAALPALAGPQAIWAEHGELVSEPWQGEAPADVVLVLRDSFSVGGTLTTDSSNWWRYTGERRVVVYREDRHLSIPVAKLQGVPDGEWGPLAVPWSEGARYVAALEGVPIPPQIVELGTPRPGEHRRLAFEARKAECELWFEVVDEAGAPVEDAEVVAWWGQRTAAHGRNVVRGAARSDGLVWLGSFPAGTVDYRTRAPGFAGKNGTMRVPVEARIVVTLRRGGDVRGRCLHGGEPVRDFQVSVRRAGPVAELNIESFLGAKDGEFVVEGLEPGEWRLAPSSARSPAGRPVAVQVRANETAEVTLEIADPLPGGGRVIDRETGASVPDAVVQVFTPAELEAGPPWGPPIACAPDGTFEADAFALGGNHIAVRAPGYAEESRRAIATTADFLDWGEIQLSRPQELVLELDGVEELDGRSVSALQASTLGGHLAPLMPFDDRGRARLEGIPPGDHQLLLAWSEASWSRLQLELEAGADWTHRFRIAGDRRLAVRLLEADGAVHTDPAHVLVSSMEPGGIATLRAELLPDAEGWFRFAGIGAERVQVMVYDLAGESVANRTVDLERGATEVELPLGGELFHVRVVDPDGAALAGAWVTIRSRAGDVVHGASQTGADGLAALLGVPAEAVLADLTQDRAGWRFGVPLDASVREHELVLEATGALELRIADGDEPLGDVTTRMETPNGVALTRPRPTGTDGRLRYAPLGAGRYRIVCQRADCWPAVIEHELAAGEAATLDVPMRRLADVELTVRNAAGLPVSGAELRLRALDLDADVGAWLRDGRVRGPATPRTGADGTLTLEGLPRGAYGWEIALGDGAASGTFELAPGGGNRHTLLVP